MIKKIVTFSPLDPNFKDEVVKLKKFQLKISKSASDRKAQNYSPANFILEDQKALSIHMRDGQIVGFGSVYKPSFFPNNAARILNRWYKSKEIRLFRSSILVDSLKIIKQQVDFCIEHNPEIEYVFFSREVPSSYYMKKTQVELNDSSEWSNWAYNEKLFLVCDHEPSPSCWQHIVSLNIKDRKSSFDFPNFKTMSLSSWQKKFMN